MAECSLSLVSMKASRLQQRSTTTSGLGFRVQGAHLACPQVSFTAIRSDLQFDGTLDSEENCSRCIHPGVPLGNHPFFGLEIVIDRP